MKKKSPQRINRHKRKYFDLRFPHIRTAFLISTLAIIALAVSYFLDKQGIPFWSSIFANIFAGFVTGLIICIISGKKQRKIALIKNELDFLNKLQDTLKEYLSLHGKLMRTPAKDFNNNSNLFDFIYDVGACASGVNVYIGQRTFDAFYAFDPIEYCKRKFGYDTMIMSERNEKLRDYISGIEIYWPSKKEIMDQFEPIHKQLVSLNVAVIKEIDQLNILLETIEHSLL